MNERVSHLSLVHGSTPSEISSNELQARQDHPAGRDLDVDPGVQVRRALEALQVETGLSDIQMLHAVAVWSSMVLGFLGDEDPEGGDGAAFG